MSLHVEIIAVTLFRQNCTLMWDDETNEAVFTDVGGNVPRLLEEAEKRGLHVKAIWLTHGHLDHVGGVTTRSEERRVGKECRSRWSPYH